MPLHKKKPFALTQPPQDLDPEEFVYQIRFTKEIFQDYQEYLNRLNFYRRRIWTCKITGKTNMTYEEALVSERRAAEKVQQFPSELMAPVLKLIQYSTHTLTDLVEEIYTKLQEHPFEGMELHGKKDQSVQACKLLKILNGGNEIQYEVGWLDKDKTVSETSVLKEDDLIRRKSPCSRSILKAFLRESTSRSSPWVIHEWLAKKHGISTKPPDDLEDRLRACTSEKGKKRKNITENGSMVDTDMTMKRAMKEQQPVKYPVDDLLVQPAADDPAFSDRPPLSTNFKVPMDCVGDILMIWDFCHSFGRLLNLWRFSLEDFENAICHKDSNVVLVVESHAAILRLLIKDEGNYYMAMQDRRRKSKITLVTWTEYLCDFLEMEGRAEFSKHLGTIRRGHYGLLDINVKLRILQELVDEALTTNAVRARLDECIEQQQALAVMRREENRKIKEEKSLKDETSDKQGCQEHNLENVRENVCSSDDNDMDVKCEDGPLVGRAEVSKRNRMQENGERKQQAANSREFMMVNGRSSKKIKDVSASKGKRGKKHTENDAHEKQPEIDQKDNLEKKLEKLSIRTNFVGKDRNYCRYWFFRREGRLFVESSDSREWGYYTSKEELDALMGSLNPKGERERFLRRQLEKYYQKISSALQKRSKEVAQKVLQEEGELRRSTRVRAQPREKPAFLRYVNKWKDD